MKQILLLFIITCFSASINAQDIYEVKKDDNKIIYGDTVKLFLGDKIFIEANFVNNSLKDFKIVKAITDSSKTITLEFEYLTMGGEKTTRLFITNPFEKYLNYKAKIKPLAGNSYSETSIEPIIPRIFAMELWPYKIDSIILYNFKLEQE